MAYEGLRTRREARGKPRKAQAAQDLPGKPRDPHGKPRAGEGALKPREAQKGPGSPRRAGKARKAQKNPARLIAP